MFNDIGSIAARNPTKWINPIETVAMYDFQARNPTELSMHSNQPLLIAPREIQNTLGMLNTGWAIACTVNQQNVGIIPINYVKSPQQLREEQQQPKCLNQQQPMSQLTEPNINKQPQPALMDLSASSFPAPPTIQQNDGTDALPDFDIAPQPLGKTNTVSILAPSGSDEI